MKEEIFFLLLEISWKFLLLKKVEVENYFFKDQNNLTLPYIHIYQYISYVYLFCGKFFVCNNLICGINFKLYLILNYI